MASTKNIQQVKLLEEKLKKSKSVVLSNYSGLNVAKLNKLKQEIKESGGEYKIAKNTLLKISFENLKYKPKEKIEKTLTGPTATLFCYEDEIKPLKILYEFYKKNSLPKIKLGFLGKDLLLQNAIINLAKLPSLEILQAKLVKTLQNPISSLTYLLKTNLQGLTTALNQLKEKREQTTPSN